MVHWCEGTFLGGKSGSHSFSTMTFHDFSWPKNENPWHISTAYFSKQTIYDLWMHTRISSDNSCSCSSYYCQEDKTTDVFTHISKYFTTVCPTRLHSVMCVFIQLNQWKLPTGWHYRNRISQCSCKNSMTLSSFSRTFHNFPWPLLFSITFQAWKMVLQNSMAFQDQWAPCKYIICLQVQYSRYTGHRLNNAFITTWQAPP